MELDKLDIQKMRIVEVHSIRPDVCFINTAYCNEQNSDLYKIDNGFVWVNSMIFVTNEGESFKSTWKKVLKVSDAKKVVIKSSLQDMIYPPVDSVLEEHEVGA